MAKGEFRVSFSGINLYQDCPRKWFYERHPDVPKRTDYARLCGTGVHRHVM